MDQDSEINSTPKSKDEISDEESSEELTAQPDESQYETGYQLPQVSHITQEEVDKSGEPERWTDLLENLPIWVVSIAVFFTGLVAMIQPLAERIAHYPKLFSLVVPYDYYHFSKSLHVVFGLFLIYLSFNLFKRKQSALWTTMFLVVASALLHIARLGSEYITWIKDRDLNSLISNITVTVPIFAAALLWCFRSRFIVKSERPSLGTGVKRLIFSFLIVLVYGTVGFFLLEKRDFQINFELYDAFMRCLREITLIGNPDLTPHSRFAKWFLDSLHVFGGFAAAYGAYSLFRPVYYQLSTQPKEREHALVLLKENGKDALDHYKVMPDKSYFFLESNRTFIAYKTVLNVAIGLGDPVGVSNELQTVTTEFREFCHENDWKMAFLQVKPDNLEMYKKVGLEVLKVGEEAVINLDHFAEKTVKGKNFKSKIKKFEKDGFVLEKRTAPHTVELLDEVKAVSDEWLSLPGRRERGFSLGWFDREMVAHETLFVLKDPKGAIIAFVNQVPSYADQEASIDMMRHRENVPNGTMDFLFAKLLLALKEDGFHRFNLGLAALSGVGDDKDASLEERAIHEIYEHMNRFFSYKGLRQYKNKFDPIWKESYLVYEGNAPGLIRTALAITRAGELT